MATRHADVVETIEKLRESGFLVSTGFDQEDKVPFPKFCELFIRVTYKKFLDEKTSGDQVFTYLYKELSDNVFQNNCAFTTEFLVKEMEDKLIKSIKKYFTNLIII